jgi:hypothetical protein
VWNPESNEKIGKKKEPVMAPTLQGEERVEKGDLART